MRSLSIGMWVAMISLFLIYPLLGSLGMSYVETGHGLVPWLCWVLAALNAVIQCYASSLADYYADLADYDEFETSAREYVQMCKAARNIR